MPVNIDVLYGDAFFRGRSKYHWRANIVCGAVVDVLNQHCVSRLFQRHVTSAVDVGCATGDLVKGFLDLGLEAYGIEGAESAEPYLVCPREQVTFHDLRQPLPQWRRVDVVTCFEVAEHLEPEYADQFVDTLCSLSQIIVMSACPPNPGGRPPTKYHLNEQPFEYWYEKFRARHYSQLPLVETALRQRWFEWRRKYGIAAYWQNLLCLGAGL